jgi:L-ascorbate metabolism protein UlaG (beta-lactamase superfamily)
MQVRRLSWAGIEITSGDHSILIDPMETPAPVEAVMGKPRWELVPVPGNRNAALITHNHPDHYDPSSLKRAVGTNGSVFCPGEIVAELKRDGIGARGVDLWETVRLGKTLSITAVPAVDWIGDAQVSWVVDDGEHRIFHGGDTIWHGSWWAISERFKGFDLAFLPANGVVAKVPGIVPSNLPGTLTPEQAVVAARLLNARLLCPIHYGQFDNADSYREHPDVLEALTAAATRENVDLLLARDGEMVLH